MSDFVLDASVTLSWFLEDEFDPYADKVAQAMRAGATPVVPGLWAMETVNGVLKAERRGRIPKDKAQEIITLLKGLPVTFDDVEPRVAFTEAFSIARSLDRSAYDAMYFELGLRRGLPIASADGPVRQAVKKAGLKIFLE